jgi:BASS family bile acid:Na+ symporter
MLLIAVSLHNILGLTLGYWTSRAFRLDKKDAQTIAIVVGSQNAAMAAGLARNMGTLGAAGLAAVIFAPVMNITGSLIANYWRRQETER